MKGRFFAFTRTLFGLGLFLLITTSCEIGLGAAVDTEAPYASIVSPSVKDAVSGDIVVTGTSTDDVKMDHMEIFSMANSVTGAKVDLLTGKAIPTSYENGVWQWTFTLKHESGRIYSYDGETFELKDGTYTLQMKACDQSGSYSSAVSRTFDVDNTPPVFLLKKPNSLRMDEATAFGQSVSIKGSVADDHNIEYMKIRLFKEDGTEVALKKNVFNGFDVSDTNVEIALYAGDDVTPSTPVQENYAIAYDLENEGTQRFRLDVELKDVAGNSTSESIKTVYIEENLQKVLASRGISNAPSGAELKQILNGSYFDKEVDLDSEQNVRLSAEQVNVVRDVLAGNPDLNEAYKYWVSDTDDDYLLALRVNVRSNPTYTINNTALKLNSDEAEILTAESWEKIAQNAKLTFIVKQGADANGVVPSSISAKIYKAPEASLTQEAFDNLFTDENLVWNSADAENWQNLYYSEAQDGNYLKDRVNPVATASYILQLPELEQGSYYVIKLFGEDTKEVSLIPESQSYFGFLASGNGNAPGLDAEKNQIVKYVEGSPFDFVLTVNDSLKEPSGNPHYTTDDGIQINYELYRGYAKNTDDLSSLTKISSASGILQDKPDGSTVFVKDNAKSNTESGIYVYNVKIPGDGTAAGDNYTYLLTVRAKNGGGESNKEKYLFHVDGKIPTLTISGAEFIDGSLIKEDSARYNASHNSNEYQVSGTWADDCSGIKRLYYTIGSDDTEHNITELTTPVADSTGWTTILENITDSHGVSYTFFAEDAVGNKCNLLPRNVKFDLSDPVIEITPVPTDNKITNEDISYTVEAEDGYGMKSLAITPTKKDGTSNGVGVDNDATITDPKKKKSTVTFSKVSGDGIWTVNVEATDDNNRKSNKSFKLTVDGTKPVIQPTFTVDNYSGTKNATAKNFFTESSINITGFAREETSGLSKIYWDRKRSTEAEPSALSKSFDVSGTSVGNNYAPFSFNVPGLEEAVGDVHDRIWLQAEDAAGNKSDKLYYDIYVDSTDPSLKVLGYSLGSSYYSISENVYHSGKEMTVYGQISDAGTGVDRLEVSGVSAVVSYSVQDVTESNYNSDIWNAEPASDGNAIKSWKAVFTPSGSENVTAKAYDKSGRSSSLTVCSLQKDTVGPKVEGLNIANGVSIFETNDMLKKVGDDWKLTVSGKWSDEESGTNILKYRIKTGASWGDYVPVDDAPRQKSSVGWSFSFNAVEGSGQELEIVAEDAVGNETSVSITGVTIDWSKPTLTPPSYNSIYKAGDLPDGKKLSFEFNASDSYNLESTSITAERIGDSTFDSTAASVGLELNNDITIGKNQTASAVLTSPLADGTWKITAVAKDKAGRLSDPCEINLTIDGVEPVISDALKLSYMENDERIEKDWSNSVYFGKTAMTFAGTVTEAVGLKSVYYKIVEGTASTAVPGKATFKSVADGAIALSGKNTVTFGATSTAFKSDSSDGKYNILYLQAEDNAGNLSDVKPFDVHVDMTAATLDVSDFANGDVTPSSYTGSILTNKGDNLHIFGTVSDSVSGLDRLELYQGSSKITAVTLKYAASASLAAATWGDLNDSNCKSVNLWRAGFAKGDIPNGNVTVKAYDRAGNEADANFAVVVDENEPTLSNVVLNGNGSYLKVENDGTETTETYYIKNDTAETGIFTISGVTNDDYKIGKTSCVLKKGDEIVAGPFETSGADVTWSFTLNMKNSSVWPDKTEGIIEITTFDAAGNKGFETFNLEIDNTKPSILSHVFTANYKYGTEDVKKDQVFFVGGGKYSESSFSKSTSLPVSGYYKEEGSGIKEIYYYVEQLAKNSSVSRNSDYVKQNKNGTFSVSGNGTIHPQYNGNDVRKYVLYGVEGKPVVNSGKIAEEDFPASKYYSFGETLAGFKPTTEANRNVLYLVAVDNCGNMSDPKKVFVNVDADLGDITSDTMGDKPTNGTSEFTLTGTAEDKLSGIEIMNFMIKSTDGTKQYPIFSYDASSALNKEMYGSAHTDVMNYLASKGYDYESRGIARFYRYDDDTDSYADEYEKVDFYRKDDNSWSNPGDGKYPSFFLEDGPHKIKWELKINPKSTWFTTENLGTSPKVYAIVKDWAGNPSEETEVYYPVATLKLDTLKPSVLVTSPSVSSKVNGTLSITGTVSDVGSAPRSIVLYSYTGTSEPPTKLSEGWTAFKGLTTLTGTVKDETDAITLTNANVSSIYNFSIDGYNFNASLGGNQTGTVYLLPVAYDEAGNTSVNLNDITPTDYKTYNVDLDTDRPLISMNEITGVGSVESERYISKFRSNIGGIVKDDDLISEIKISKDPILSSEGWAAYNQVGRLTCNLGTSIVTFDYEPADTTDSVKTLYIYVKDSAGGEFWTAHTTAWKQPKVKYAKTTSETSLNSVITYVSDSTPPEAHMYVEAAGSENIAKDAVKISSTQASGILKAGGNKAFVVARVDASDLIGVASVSGVLTGEGGKSQNVSFSEDPAASGKYYTTINGSTLSGQKTLAVTVKDKSGFENHPFANLFFDNEGPNITMTTKSDIAFIGEVSARGTASDDAGTPVTFLNCLLLSDDYYNGVADLSNNNVDKNKAKSWLTNPVNAHTPASFFNWSFDLEMPAGSESALAKYKKFENPDETYDMRVALLGRDELGNETFEVKTIKYNPYADRPTAQIVYPDVKAGSSAADVSGTIRVSGTASDNFEVSKVYLQVSFGHSGLKNESGIKTMWESKSNAEDGLWNRETFLSALEDSNVRTSYSNLIKGPEAVTSSETDPEFWGIEATSTDSWYITLNKLREFQNSASCDDSNAADREKTYTVWIRAIAVDNNGLLGKWSEPVALSLNPNAPVIGDAVPAVVEIYDNKDYNGTPKIVAYTADMWINGYAKLSTSAEHTNGISDLSYKVGTTTTVAVDSEQIIAGSDIVSGLDAGNGYRISIPLTAEEETGSWQVDLTAIEGGNGLTKTETYTINYDRKKPDIGGFTLNDEEFAVDAKMQNSNLRLTVGGDVEDDASGFERLLFYFIRGKDPNAVGSTTRVFDPYFDYKTSSENSKIVIGDDFDSMSIDGKSLYGSWKNVTWGANDKSKIIMSTADVHVRKGGMVVVDGVWYKIGSVSGTEVTLDKALPEDVTPASSVFFPYAMVVDNTSSETIKTWTTSGHTFKGLEDGDGMPESISKLSSTWTWDATLHGNYIPDGPVELVVFAQDKAGNISASSIKGTLQNNPPRLAKVYLGTDLDRDGKYSDFEFETYDIYGVEKNYKEAFNLITAGYKVMDGNEAKNSDRGAFIAKKNLAVYPEFIGGMDPIKVVFTRSQEALTPVSGSDGTLREADATKVDADSVFSKGIYEFTNEDLVGKVSYNNDDDKTTPVHLSFWDSTDGLTCGSTSQYSVLRIADLNLDLTDVKAPTNVISPFYWKGADDNSLYMESTENGHIELEGDWMVSGTAYDSTKTSGVEDGDPKVSGKIKIEGYAYDETLLSSISVKVGEFDFAGHLGKDGAYKKVATYAGGKWTLPSATVKDDGWSFAVDDRDPESYFGQRGHKVKWILNLDTEKLDPVAAYDVETSVLSKDAGGKVSSDDFVATGGDGLCNKTVYRMDVVPYITSVKTILSEKSSNPDSSEYDRTAMGHYPVQMMYGATVSETVKISGFNLGAATVEKSVENSGEIFVKVGSVASINNKNNNDAHGSYSGGDDDLLKSYMAEGATIPASGNYDLYSNFYNRRPNGVSNNNLNDDVFLDVWVINSEAAVGLSGRGKLQGLAMKTNPSSKQLGFAFTNGSTSISAPDGTSNSYALWAKDYDVWSAVAMTFDGAGNSYMLGCGGDINDSNGASKFNFFSSRWGKGTSNSLAGGKNGTNALRIEEIGQKGTKYSGSTIAMDKRRIQSPSLAAHSYAGIGKKATTNVYAAYYDSMNAEIRFKWGKFTKDSKEEAQYFVDYYKDNEVSADGQDHQYNPMYAQVLAENVTTTTTTLGTAGAYVSLDVIPDTNGNDTVVLVWYDGTDTLFTYSKSDKHITDSTPSNLSGNGANGAGRYAGTGKISDYWAPPVKIFEGFGSFCKIAADKNGGVHIAAQDPSSGGDLHYAYLSSPTSTPVKCLVDSCGNVGSQLTIDVGVDGSGVIVPHISYYGEAMPKMAYLPGGVETLAAGADENELFTGVWECGYVPTSSDVPEDKINVCLWKNNGVITDSKVGNPSAVGTSSLNPSGNTGTCYGNGSSNPVVGYVRKQNSAVYWVETAQKK